MTPETTSIVRSHPAGRARRRHLRGAARSLTGMGVVLALAVMGVETVAAAPAVAAGGCNTFTATSGDWNVASNWSLAKVPDESMGACIGSGHSAVVAPNSSGHAAYLVVDAGGKLTVAADGGQSAGLFIYDGQRLPDGTLAPTFQGVENAGTIEVRSSAQVEAQFYLYDQARPDGTLGSVVHNTGTIVGSGPNTSYPALVEGSLSNDGTIEATSGFLALLLGKESHNRGTLRADPGAMLSLDTYNSGPFYQDAGTIDAQSANGVDGIVFDNGCDVHFVGGTISGLPVVAAGGRVWADGTGSGTLAVQAGSTVHLESDIGAGYSITQPSGGYLSIDKDGLTNHGTIDLHNTSAARGQIFGDAMVNAGTMTVASDDSSGYAVLAPVTNTGTLTIAKGPVGSNQSITQAGGTLTVNSEASFTPQNLTVSGGKLVNDGSIPVGYAFSATGGQMVGNPVLTQYGVSLSGTGSGTIDTTGSTLNSDIPAGYTVIVNSVLGANTPTN